MVLLAPITPAVNKALSPLSFENDQLKKCPDSLDGAKVISTALPGRAVTSLIAGHETPIVAYALARHDDENGFYLFALSESWEVIGDTFRPSIAEAKRQEMCEAGIELGNWNDKRQQTNQPDRGS